MERPNGRQHVESVTLSTPEWRTQGSIIPSNTEGDLKAQLSTVWGPFFPETKHMRCEVRDEGLLHCPSLSRTGSEFGTLQSES